MRTAILFCLLLVSAYAANSQLSILPQLGIENSRTAIAVNKQSSFSPLNSNFSLQAAIRSEYRFKKGHGPFIGMATSRSLVKYSFSNTEAAMTAYTASKGITQLRLEGGYQVATKPLYFRKAATTQRSAGSYNPKPENRTGCSKYSARSGCAGKSTKTKTAAVQDTRSWMRILPSLGAAYIPGTPRAEIYSDEQSTYVYNAGNWTTALLGGVAVEFGKGSQRNLNISLNYVKGLGNLDTKTLTNLVENKPVTTTLKSTSSSWNLRMGIPISFGKKQAAVKQPARQKTYSPERKCGQYKSSYNGRCTRVI
jgi:hypothetical protein